MLTKKDISIVVPLAPGETAWPQLINNLKQFGLDSQMILVGVKGEPPLQGDFTYLTVPQGRALQLNCGARAVQTDYVWFVHADSFFKSDPWPLLLKSLAPHHLCYFNLKFLADGPRLMAINAWGAFLRSHVLRSPYGDQALCLSREAYNKIGGFPEDGTYGEDHLFVWHAQQAGLKLKCVGMSLWTSARKYQKYGWLKLTLLYSWLWTKQVLPEFFKWLKIKCIR